MSVTPSRTDFWGTYTFSVLRCSHIRRACTLGVELTAKKKEAIWDGEEEDDEPRDDPDIVHTLHIQRVSKSFVLYCAQSRDIQVILGANVKDESHLVTITAQNCAGEDLTHPLCWLSKKSISESQVRAVV